MQEIVDEELLTDVIESDETEEERQARIDTEVVLDELSREFVDDLTAKILILVDEISGHPLRPYQTPIARRVVESLIIGDGATITALISRQAGKSELVANVTAACMILLPRLAAMFPDLLGKFKEGVWVGAFAPVDEQADNLYGRIVSRLTSDAALAFMSDPEIGEEVIGRGKELKLKNCGSLVRKTTCHPRAKIEGRTYHLILVDECQGADEKVINKSVAPMGASTNATMVFTGTPTYTKGVFYKTIQINKRAGTKRGARQDHYEADWKTVAKYNTNYKKFVSKEILRIGQESDEFKLSYRLIWLLDRGMFTTAEKLDTLGDKSMQMQHAWMKSPVIVGIDPARKIDSTIVTVCWVGWDYPDQFGRFEHRVLSWLDLTGVEWEEQYFRIVEYLSNFHVFAIGVDQGGVGDTVISRLRVLMPGVEIVAVPSDRGAQSKRWRYLMDLMRDGKIGWPAHAKTRALRVWRKFRQQMEDAEIRYEGPNVIVEAPDETGAHDDFVDSLAICTSISEQFAVAEVESSENVFYAA